MTPARYKKLQDAIGAFDAKMRRLADLGIDLSRPGRELLADLRARKDERARQHAELEETQREADRQLLAELLDLYMNGDAADRERVRELLDQHRTFRWGFGWGLATRIATAEDARGALAVLSMKDGNGDYRDAIVALDRLCSALRAAGLEVAPLLREAATWSSDVSWFPPMSPMRALLTRYAERFASNR